MPLLSGMKSDFGNFFTSSELHRKLGLALAFAVFGLVASASSIVLLTADDESDPRNAFAGAHLPAPAARAAPTTAAVDTPAAHAVQASKADMAERAKPCQNNASDGVGADCASASTRKPDVALAVSVTDPPAPPKAPTRTPISHDNGPTVAAPPSAALVAGAQPRDESVSDPADAAAAPLAAAALPPAPVAAKPQKTSRHASRRAPQYQQMSLWPFDIRPARGYARQRSFFW